MFNIKVNTYLDSNYSQLFYAEHEVEILTHVPREKEYLIKRLIEPVNWEEKTPTTLEKLIELIIAEKENPTKTDDSPLDSVSEKLRQQILDHYKQWGNTADNDQVISFLNQLDSTELFEMCFAVYYDYSGGDMIDSEELYADDYGTVGYIQILQIKTADLDKSRILRIADLNANLLDAVAYFYAPQADPNHSLELNPLVTVNSGIHRALEADGLTGAYHPKYRNGNYPSLVDTLDFPVDNFWYIDDIYVQPYYRKRNLGRLALALFLNHYHDNGNIIALHPHPSHDLFEKYEHDLEKAKVHLLEYFEPFYFSHYSPDSNLLWDTFCENPDFFCDFIHDPVKYYNGNL